MSLPVPPTRENKIAIAAIRAIARAQRMAPAFDISRALHVAGEIEAILSPHMTAEGTFALCALLLKGVGIRDARELGELLRD